jgi:sRNA-binding protein
MPEIPENPTPAATEATAPVVIEIASATPPDEAVAATAPDVSPSAGAEAPPEVPAEGADHDSEAASTSEPPAESAHVAVAAPVAPELSPAACAALLAERFPALFGAGRALPIKLRIQADIQARAPGVFTKKSLSTFLHRHTTGTAYLKSLVSQPQRYDLDGQPAGEVAEEHRAAATVEVERRRGIVDARRQAERDAQRQAHAAERDAARRAQSEARAAAQAAHAAARAAAAAAQPADAPPAEAAHPVAPPPPRLSAAEVEARRDRAALLRAWETSTLTRANFCVLKRIAEADLEAQLVVARQEREQRPQDPRPEPRSHDARRDGGPDANRDRGPRRDERGPRPIRGDARSAGGRPQGKAPVKPMR